MQIWIGGMMIKSLNDYYKADETFDKEKVVKVGKNSPLYCKTLDYYADLYKKNGLDKKFIKKLFTYKGYKLHTGFKVVVLYFLYVNADKSYTMKQILRHLSNLNIDALTYAIKFTPTEFFCHFFKLIRASKVVLTTGHKEKYKYSFNLDLEPLFEVGFFNALIKNKRTLSHLPCLYYTGKILSYVINNPHTTVTQIANNIFFSKANVYDKTNLLIDIGILSYELIEKKEKLLFIKDE